MHPGCLCHPHSVRWFVLDGLSQDTAKVSGSAGGSRVVEVEQYDVQRRGYDKLYYPFPIFVMWCGWGCAAAAWTCGDGGDQLMDDAGEEPYGVGAADWPGIYT